MPSAPATDAAAYPLLIKQLLLTPLAVSPGQEIVYGDTVRYDYRTLHARIGQLAGLLTSLGVKHGDTVAVMDWDTNRYLEAYFAVPMIGAVLMMVNIRLAPEQIAYTLNHSGARVLLVNREFLPLLDGIDEQLPDLRTRILMEDAHGPLPAGFVAEYEAGLRDAAAASEFPDFDENTRATVFYTTGTTGLPKGVSFSHRQLVLHSLAGMAALGSAASQGRLHRDDVYMPITPMFHVHAWGLPYVATLMGIKQVYPGRYLPGNLLALIAREKVTFSHCVPTILHMLLEHPDAAQADLRGWKVIIGGAALPRALAQRALARGIDIFGGYGMSETCPLLTVAQIDVDTSTDPDEALSLRTKAGTPVPLVDLRIVDPDMADVAHDGLATGEVVARAPWLTGGYLHDPAASAALWAGGYLHTGGHRQHRRRRLPAGDRPYQGRDQDRWRVDLLAGSGRHHRAAPGRQRGCGDWYQRHEMGRAPVATRGQEAGQRGERGRNHRAGRSAQSFGGYLTLCDSGACEFRGIDRADQRGQDQQEEAARAA